MTIIQKDCHEINGAEEQTCPWSQQPQTLNTSLLPPEQTLDINSGLSSLHSGQVPVKTCPFWTWCCPGLDTARCISTCNVSSELWLVSKTRKSSLCSTCYHKPPVLPAQAGQGVSEGVSRMSYYSPEQNHLLSALSGAFPAAPGSLGAQLFVAALLPQGTGRSCPESKA